MHQQKSFDIVSRRGLEKVQGELFNNTFYETQRSAGSALIGVSSFNMRIWVLRDSPQRYRIAISLSWLQAGMSCVIHCLVSVLGQPDD